MVAPQVNNPGELTPAVRRALSAFREWVNATLTTEIAAAISALVIPVVKQTEIDFGSTPVESSTFTVTDSAVSATSQIIAQVAYEAPTGKDLDEIEMDSLSIRCAPGSGQFTMFITSTDGSYLSGTFKINYVVG